MSVSKYKVNCPKHIHFHTLNTSTGTATFVFFDATNHQYWITYKMNQFAKGSSMEDIALQLKNQVADGIHYKGVRNDMIVNVGFDNYCKVPFTDHPADKYGNPDGIKVVSYSEQHGTVTLSVAGHGAYTFDVSKYGKQPAPAYAWFLLHDACGSNGVVNNTGTRLSYNRVSKKISIHTPVKIEQAPEPEHDFSKPSAQFVPYNLSDSAVRNTLRGRWYVEDKDTAKCEKMVTSFECDSSGRWTINGNTTMYFFNRCRWIDSDIKICGTLTEQV